MPATSVSQTSASIPMAILIASTSRRNCGSGSRPCSGASASSIHTAACPVRKGKSRRMLSTLPSRPSCSSERHRCRALRASGSWPAALRNADSGRSTLTGKHNGLRVAYAWPVTQDAAWARSNETRRRCGLLLTRNPPVPRLHRDSHGMERRARKFAKRKFRAWCSTAELRLRRGDGIRTRDFQKKVHVGFASEDAPDTARKAVSHTRAFLSPAS